MGSAGTAAPPSADGATARRHSATGAGLTSSILGTVTGTRTAAGRSTPPRRGGGVYLWIHGSIPRADRITRSPPMPPRDPVTMPGQGIPPLQRGGGERTLRAATTQRRGPSQRRGASPPSLVELGMSGGGGGTERRQTRSTPPLARGRRTAGGRLVTRNVTRRPRSTGRFGRTMSTTRS